MKTAIAAAVPALLVALLYFLGNVYLSAYYGFYGVDPQELNIGTQNVLYDAYPALYTWLNQQWPNLLSWLVLLVLAGWAAASLAGPTSQRWLLGQRFPLLVVAIVLLFIFAYPIGVYSGQRRAELELYNLPPLQIALKVGDHAPQCVPASVPCPNLGDLHFLAEGPSDLFAISYRPGKDFWTYRLPREELSLSRAYR